MSTGAPPVLTIEIPFEGRPKVFLYGCNSDEDWARFEDWLHSNEKLIGLFQLAAQLARAEAA